jgi:hypothetical protein
MAAKDHVAVRLDPPTLERLDLLREVLTTDWHEATQSDVLRAVILTGLKLLEKEHGPKLEGVRKKREADKREAERLEAEKRDAAPEKPSTPSSKRGKKSKG